MKLPALSPRASKIHLGVTLPLLALLAYNSFLAGLYDFGVQQLTAERFAIFVFWSMSSLACLPDRVEKPSDVFWTFYLFLSGIWGASLWGLTGSVSFGACILWLILLHAPAYAFRGLSLLGPKLSRCVPLIQIYNPRLLILPFLILLILAILATVGAAQIGSFDFLSLYDRRIAGRAIIPERSIQAYLFGMTANGGTVLLAYLVGRHRSVLGKSVV